MSVNFDGHLDSITDNRDHARKGSLSRVTYCTRSIASSLRPSARYLAGRTFTCSRASAKMDPDSFQSMMSNLALDNVMAAAARDYQKASLGKSSLHIKVGQSSLESMQRSRSPKLFERQQMQTSPKRSTGSLERGPESKHENGPFDICRPLNVGVVELNKPLHVLKRERKMEHGRSKNAQYLRSGMVLLKGFLNLMDQVKIVRECRELGIGCGGFYTPVFSDGSKLHLKMMCLGMNWNPELKSYSNICLDGAIPPEIPEEFKNLVDGAIHYSHEILRKNAKKEDEIPKMSPNICIVNFYSNNGRLRLHQDKDESRESLLKGLPVVSFSIGDSAEFLYSDQRKEDEADKVLLESGDVLIFGGESRHVFHGVPFIKPNTAPRFLANETNLRPGRLNLTFRQF